MKQSIITLLFIFTLSLTGSPSCNAQSPSASSEKKILVLHSYHKGFSWTEGIDEGLKEQLSVLTNVDVVTDYLDTKRYPLEDNEEPWAIDYLLKQYKDIQFDLIIVVDNNALKLLQVYQKKLFPNIPVVFCGINNFSPNMIAGLENRITGVIEANDPVQTVHLITQLQPELKKLIIISGTTPTAQAVKEETETALKTHTYPFNIEWWDGYTSEKLTSDLEKLDRHDAVLLILFNRSGDGEYYSYESSSHMISRHAPCPVYGMWDFYLHHGVIGGMMVSSKDQGSVAGQLATEYIKTGQFPPIVSSSPNRAIIDLTLLKKYNLSRSGLPDNVLLIEPEQPEPSLFEKLFYNANATLLICLSGMII